MPTSLETAGLQRATVVLVNLKKKKMKTSKMYATLLALQRLLTKHALLLNPEKVDIVRMRNLSI